MIHGVKTYDIPAPDTGVEIVDHYASVSDLDHERVYPKIAKKEIPHSLPDLRFKLKTYEEKSIVACFFCSFTNLIRL